jgi:hypothetical protein
LAPSPEVLRVSTYPPPHLPEVSIGSSVYQQPGTKVDRSCHSKEGFQVINKPCMRSRCMSLLPRTTLHSDSEQYALVHTLGIYSTHLVCFTNIGLYRSWFVLSNSSFLIVSLCFIWSKLGFHNSVKIGFP